MSKQRIEARNAKIKARQEEQKKTQSLVPATKKELTQEEVHTKLRLLKSAWKEAQTNTKKFMKMQGVEEDSYMDQETLSYVKFSVTTEENPASTLRFMPARTIRGHTHEAHFAGPGSALVNIEYQKHKMLEKKAWNAFLTYRSSNDKEWIQSQQENKAKIELFQRIFGEEKKTAPTKKKIIEVVHQMHSNPLDTSSYIMCRHYDQSTWEILDCDCTKTYTCGCIVESVCNTHNLSLCECSTVTRISKPNFVYKCEVHTKYPKGWWELESDVNNIKPSLRARARVAQNKLVIAPFGNTKIKVVRTSVGTILTKDKNGQLDEDCIRCYHTIIPTGDSIRCDCSKDILHGFQFSDKMKLMKPEDIVLDESYLIAQRNLMKQESTRDVILNPFGLAGPLRPNYSPVHPSVAAHEETLVAQAVKMHLV